MEGFPAAGSQIKRKSDGVLGEVYATDPPAKLSVRWPTVPGAYAREDCTAEQFAQAWELTGARLTPPPETHVALGLIASAVLLFFLFVLVHDRTSASTGYDAYKPLAGDTAEVLNSAKELNAKYGMQAAQVCAAGADEFIRSLTRHRFHWQSNDALTPRFDKFNPQLTAPGVLTLLSKQASVSNGFGVFTPIEIACNYDTQSREVLSYDSQGDEQ
jgi:hypothetical protein